MTSRALVIGAQLDGLRGVVSDTERIHALLDARGFEVDLRRGADATRAGILAGYDRLIAASAPGDAAVLYYSGHGYHAVVADEQRAWQCIAPTDLRASTDADWRGITAWELSIKQAQLTARTRNVTVLLDCCHAAQLSRAAGPAGAMARALPHPVQRGFDRHLAALRALHGDAVDAVDPISDPHAVRVVACGQREAAFEYEASTGVHRGAFTEALVDLLAELADAPVSWATLLYPLRARVRQRFPHQSPGLEGPARRAPFSLVEHPDDGRVSVSVVGDHAALGAGRLLGVSPGDRYRIVGAPGGASAALEVTEVSGTAARARWLGPRPELAPGTIAIPVERWPARWPIAIAGPPAQCAIARRRIDASPTLRAATPADPAAIATLVVAADTATIVDDDGPLAPAVRFPDSLDLALAHLSTLADGHRLAALDGEHGVAADELAIELGLVRAGQLCPLPDHGALVSIQDRYYLRVTRRGARTLFVHVFGVSASGKRTLLTHFARRGVALDRDQPTVTLGERADGACVGVGLRWPEGVPELGAPRQLALFVLATTTATDLSALETHAARDHDRADSALRALDQLSARAYRDAAGPAPRDGFSLTRLTLRLRQR